MLVFFVIFNTGGRGGGGGGIKLVAWQARDSTYHKHMYSNIARVKVDVYIVLHT